MKILSPDLINQFRKSGRIILPSSLSVTGRELIPDFIRLTEEPEEYRKQWEFDLNFSVTGKKDPDDGLIERKPEEGKDQKFFFHYRPHLRRMLKDRGIDISAYINFLDQCDTFYAMSAFAMEVILRNLDVNFPKYEIMKRLERRSILDRHCIRFLRYKPGQEILAEKHPDRSFGTFHIAESHSGLFLGDDKEYYQVMEDKLLFFLGLKAEILTEGQWRAVRHFVKAISADWRWSIVFFTHIDVGVSEEEIEEMIKKEKESYAKY